MQRGAGIPAIERLAYVPELTSVQLKGLRHLILVDAKTPVSASTCEVCISRVPTFSIFQPMTR